MLERVPAVGTSVPALPVARSLAVGSAAVRRSENYDALGLSVDVETCDDAALTAVYLEYSDAIHSYIYRLLGNNEDADDLTQETFIRVHEHLASLRDAARLRSWLYRIATNLCMDQLRRRSRIRRLLGVALSLTPILDDHDTPNQREIAEPGSTAQIDGVAERDHIARALRRMPAKYSVCLLLHSSQGLSYREIAEVLDITPGAAAVRLTRARDLFARHYEALRQEGPA